MSYTNAQVATLVTRLDARIASLEARLGTAATSSTAAPVAATTTAAPVTIPERGTPAVKLVCAKHPDHKGGKGFSANGMAAHRTWCDGVA